MKPWYYCSVNCPFFPPVLEKEVDDDNEKGGRAIKSVEATI